MRSRISVVIPTLNRPAMLEAAVQSILAQTYPAEEIIIVDDGSEDTIRGKVKAVERLNSLISVHHLLENAGVSAARNFGLEKASGDFVLFLDDDDLLHPEMLESALDCFARNPEIDVISCRCQMFYSPGFQDGFPERGRTKNRHYPLRKISMVDRRNASKLETEPFSEIFYANLPIHSCLVRRKSLGDVRFPLDLRAGEDTFFWLRLAAHGRRFKLNPHVHAYIRRHTGNFILKPEFDQEYIQFLKKLRESGMLKSRRDHFLFHAFLFFELATTKNIKCLIHLVAAILKSPWFSIKYGIHFLSIQFNKKRTLEKIRHGGITWIGDRHP
jgi:glycosyltransferase involved in cell wall biosynthesis